MAVKLDPPPENFDFTTFFSSPNNFDPYFKFYEIDSIEIFTIIEGLQLKKSAGFDRITTKTVKENKLVLAPIITRLMNRMIANSEFPDCLKVARVTPIFKKGSKSDPCNYRPISILSTIAKIAEKVITSQIRDHLETQDLLTFSQFGYRPSKNTTHAISDLLEAIYKKLDRSCIAQTVFLDFSKAFDTINHAIVIKKLKFHNFSESATNLIESYLSNRSQCVKIQN